MFDLLIMVNTNKGLERVIIPGVIDVEYKHDTEMFIVHKQDHKVTVPREGIVFIGEYSDTIIYE